MEGLPIKGQRVKIWPDPKLKVQASELTLLEGGRWLPPDGETVTWNVFRYRQMLSGEIHLHDPRPDAKPQPGDAPSLANDVEIAQRRAKFAEDAKAEASKKLAEAQTAVEQAQVAEKQAAEAHASAMKSSQALIDKLKDRAPEEEAAPTKGSK